MGRMAPGWAWLGYRVSPAGLQVAQAMVERCVARARRLYEQQPGGAQPLARLGASVQRLLAVGVSGSPADLVGQGDAGHSL
jgi:hypothetical protein